MQAYKILSLNIELYRGKEMLDLVNVLGVDSVIYASFQIRESRQQNLHLNQKPKKLTSTPHYTERAHTVFWDPMVRSDQVIPGNLIFRDDSRAVCTGGHHIHIRYRFAPAAAARVLYSCVHLTWVTRALPARASSHSMFSFIPFSQWKMSCWNQSEIANVLWYWPPKNVLRALPKLLSSRNKPNSLNFLLIIMWNFYFDIKAFKKNI